MVKVDITDGEEIEINYQHYWLKVKWDDDKRKFICKTMEEEQELEP